MIAAERDIRIAVIGLGYVGLPLAVEFSKIRSVIGFDINSTRIENLRNGRDETLEVEPEDLIAASRLVFTDELEDLRSANFYIITVPTPIDSSKRPDLTPLIRASEAAGRVISRGDIVVYESTVYPGATEEECIPVIERVSGLTFNHDFFVGYSPERINPGDKTHRLPDIKKVVSGSTPETMDIIDEIYGQIIKAGTHRAPTIRVAEAAKVIENTQRDLNIALINELAIIFNRMGIDTQSVLEAAGTKWNFLPFRPGLVGGHCIGVDPYYLTHKAEATGHHPQIILAGRRVNDAMGRYVANQLVRAMIDRAIPVRASRVLIMGLSFKEDCPDTRNTRVVDVIDELSSYGISVEVFDPWVDPADAKVECNVVLTEEPPSGVYDAIIVAVAHTHFREMGAAALRNFGKPDHILYDLKFVLAPNESDLRL